jgi:adenine-specific DNA methylase
MISEKSENNKSFIEVQFPVSKISKESYKERKAGQSQTLTGLGKWWGRKPLILVRATILGLIMPAGNDPIKDRDIFLKILMMDANESTDKCKNK